MESKVEQGQPTKEQIEQILAALRRGLEMRLPDAIAIRDLIIHR